MKADIIIKNGMVIDCFNQTEEICDIAIKDGVIIDPSEADGGTNIINAEGCIVTPGLIDFHAHFAIKVTELSISPDPAFLPTGVTTAIDAGSTGVANYEGLRALSTCFKIKNKALLNVASAGLATTERLDPVLFDEIGILSFFKKYSDHLIGLKVRFGEELIENKDINPIKIIEACIRIAEKAGCRLYVHTTNNPLPTKILLNTLRPGDVLVHVFQGKGHTIIENGRVIPELFEAQQKGIVFDACHGTSNLNLVIAKQAISEGFRPNIISTDLAKRTCYSKPRVFSLPFVMSKFLALGLKIQEILPMVTINPARLLGCEKELGSLSVGTVADIAIHRLIDRKQLFDDLHGNFIYGEKLLKTEMTILDGQVCFWQIDFS